MGQQGNQTGLRSWKTDRWDRCEEKAVRGKKKKEREAQELPPFPFLPAKAREAVIRPSVPRRQRELPIAEPKTQN